MACIKDKRNHCRRWAGEVPADMTFELRAEGGEVWKALGKSHLCHQRAAREKKALGQEWV